MSYRPLFIAFIALSIAIFAQAVSDTWAATPCNLIQSGAQVPQGFGVPYNLFSVTNELLVSVTCPSTSSGQATLSVGSGSNVQYVYQLAHTWRQNRWQQITLQGTNLKNGVWYAGQAQGTLPQTAAELRRKNFVAAHICSWLSSQNRWACGCRDRQ